MRIGSLLLAPLVVLATSLLDGPAPEMRAETPPERAPLDSSAAECGRCHRAIHEEWAGHLHAQAFTNPVYQQALKATRKPELCLPCHTPASVQRRLGRMPEIRDAHRDEGVTCVACHDDRGRIAGPFGAETDAHPTVKHPAFTTKASISLCASCHDMKIGPVLPLARDFRAAKLDERGKSCIGCHMPRVSRAIANDASGADIGQKRKGRRHAILGPSNPDFVARAFKVSVQREGDRIVVSLGNRAGHRVPGLTLRSFVFSVAQQDARGRELETGEVTISAENLLMVGETRRFRFPAEKAVRRVQIRGEHRIHDTAVEFFDDSFDVR